MMLDQVENNIQTDPPKASVKPEIERLEKKNEGSDYLVLEGNEDLGPVYSSVQENKATDQNKEGLSEKSATSKVNIPSYIAEDTYNVPDVTKTVSEPVDHRRQGSRSAFSTSSDSLTNDVTAAYTSASSSLPMAHSHSFKPHESNPSHLPQAMNTTSPPKPLTNDKGLSKSPAKTDKNLSSIKVQKLPPSEPGSSEAGRATQSYPPSLPDRVPYSTENCTIQPQTSRSSDSNKAHATPLSQAHSTKPDTNTNTKPAWSPARETEWRMNQPSANPSSIMYERTQENTSSRHLTAGASRSAANSAYQYTQFNSGLPSTTSGSSTLDFPTPQASINYWNSNPSPYQPPVNKRTLPSPQQQQSEADRQPQRQQNKTPSQPQPSGEGERKIGHPHENTAMNNPPAKTTPYHGGRPHGSINKGHAFSTESLLNKTSEPSHVLQRKQSDANPTYKQGATNNMDHTRQLYDKDRNFMSNQNERVPYNVNLFSDSPLPSQTLSAFKSQSSSNSPYQASLSHKLPFSFALSNTQADPSTTLSSINPMRALHNSRPEQQPMPISIPTSLQESNFNHAMLMERARTDQDQMGPGRTQRKDTFHYRNMDDIAHSSLSSATEARRNSISNHQSQERQSNTTKTKKQKTVSPVTPSPAQQHNPPCEPPSLPYQFPGSAYLPAFQKPRNDGAMPTDFFNPHSFSKSVGQPFSLPFQSAGFPGLPPHSAQSFVHQAPSQLGSNQQFNFSNIFKDNPADSFKFPGANAPSNGLYSPRTSHLYSNPMSINNLIGGGNPNFDRARAHSNALPAFHSQAPGFAGFHSPFDFPLGDQQH